MFRLYAHCPDTRAIRAVEAPTTRATVQTIPRPAIRTPYYTACGETENEEEGGTTPDARATKEAC